MTGPTTNTPIRHKSGRPTTASGRKPVRPTRRTPTGPKAADVKRATAVRSIVLHHAADLVECGTLEDAAAVVCELYAALYTVAAADWLGSVSAARDLAEAIYDARAMVPILAVRYLCQAPSEWVAADRDTDYQTSLVPGHVRDYLQTMVDLLNHRLSIGPAPAVCLWATPWLLRLDATALRAALQYVAQWTPPRKKSKRSLIGSGEIRERNEQWAEYVRLKFEAVPSDETSCAAPGEHRPLSKSYFAAKHQINRSEVSRWVSPGGGIERGSIPDESIRRALKVERDSMRAAQQAAPSESR